MRGARGDRIKRDDASSTESLALADERIGRLGRNQDCDRFAGMNVRYFRPRNASENIGGWKNGLVVRDFLRKLNHPRFANGRGQIRLAIL